MENTEGGYDGGQAGEIGDTGSDHEGNGPVDGDQSGPEEFARAIGDRWEVEELNENVVIDDWILVSAESCEGAL